MKKILYKLCQLVSCFALIVTIMNVNSTCFFIVHQPQLPEGAERLKKSNRCYTDFV